MTTVGIIGGTGPAGRGVAARLAAGGHDVVIGSRDPERAAAAARRAGATVTGASNHEAARAGVVVVATPWDSAVATVTELADALSGSIVISMVNAMVREGKELVPLEVGRGSMAAEIAHALPASRVVGAFHHLPAAQLEDLGSGLVADVVIVGDDASARDAVAELVDSMPGLHAVVAGSLALAGAVEDFTAVCVSVNIRYRAHSYVRLAGL